MNGFTYQNIFDTKGIKYLVIISFRLLLIPFWLALNKKVKISEQVRKVLGVLTSAVLKVPQGIFYSKNHTWAYLKKSGNAQVSIDDLVLHITGEVKLGQLKSPGDTIKKNELLAEIEQDGKILCIYSPISGKIVDSNPELVANPDLLLKEPYEKGWLFNIKPTNWVADIHSYYLAEEATGWLQSELVRYKDFLAAKSAKYSTETSMTILQDGGELADSSLSSMPDGMWHDFQKEFLNP